MAYDSAPNIILILADDQGWTGTSVQMDPSVSNSFSDFYQTPNLERLAKQGMRFSNAYSSGPNCLPTRAAIQTGKSPAQLQMTDSPGTIQPPGFFASNRYKYFYNRQLLSPPVPERDLSVAHTTIAERIKASSPNYATAHFGKWHLGGGGPGYHGYDFHDGPTDNPGGNSQDDEDPKHIFSMTRRASDFMEPHVAADKPFFMQISHYAVHTPVQGLQETNEKYAHDRGRRHFSGDYAAMTEDLDTGVGILLDKIDELGIADNTYVIYVSDNGALKRMPKLTNNFPLAKGKGSLWEGGIRVPMVVRGPGIHADSTSDVPVTTTDLFPTISDLLGIDTPLPEGLDGGSLRAVLENGGVGRVGRSNKGLFWHFPHYEVEGGTTPHSAVRVGNYKLMKFYETGELMLIDLAEDIGETNNLLLCGRAVDCAGDVRRRRDQMHQILNDWIEQVDASVPYIVSEETELVWNADQPGTKSDVWRATTDVQHRSRESWNLTDQRPQRVAVAPHQTNLPRHAFQFDGTVGMSHRFFRVSDPDAPEPDNDHSASFEFWLRLNSMEHPHMIFETGRELMGLSLTIGDGDSDGQHDDLRFRALDFDEQYIDLTADFNRFVDPTRDFIQLVAVFSDNEADRYAELYVNGALIGHVDGIDGADDHINWDDWGNAGLGHAVGGIGGHTGDGNLPFGSGFDGELAFFRYYNHAIDGGTVRASYNNMLDDVDAGVVATSGTVRVPIERPSDVSGGAYEADDVMVVHERNDTLDDLLRLDILPKTSRIYGSDDVAPSIEGFLSDGTAVTSYLIHFDPLPIHFDPLGDPILARSAFGSVTFAEPILGILIDQRSLQDTDALLGALGRYTTDERTINLSGGDSLGISEDLRTLTLSLTAMNNQVIQLRVLTAQIPEPTSLLLMGLSMGLLSTRRRGRSRRIRIECQVPSVK